MHALSQPKKDSCKLPFLNMQGLRAGQSPAKAICSELLLFLNHERTAQERIVQGFSFSDYGRSASWARPRRCYLLCPPSCLNWATFFTAQARVMQGFFELCKVCELGKAPQVLSAPSSAMCQLWKVFYCQAKFRANFYSNICKACELGMAPPKLSVPSSCIFEL